MELYYFADSYSTPYRIMLEESALPCQAVEVDWNKPRPKSA